jgi:hypothetical protein
MQGCSYYCDYVEGVKMIFHELAAWLLLLLIMLLPFLTMDYSASGLGFLTLSYNSFRIVSVFFNYEGDAYCFFIYIMPLFELTYCFIMFILILKVVIISRLLLLIINFNYNWDCHDTQVKISRKISKINQQFIQILQ